MATTMPDHARLLQILNHRQCTFRQHLPEAAWGERKLTVVDLSPSQQAALEQGGIAGLDSHLAATGQWTFPASDITRPLAQRPHVDLQNASIIAPADGPVHALARAIAKAIEQRIGRLLPVVDANHARLSLLDKGDMIVAGGSHENAFARLLALRSRVCCFDASMPGDDGWAVTTHTGLTFAKHNVLQVAAGQMHHAAAAACLAQRVICDDERFVLRHVHSVNPGSQPARNLPSWEAFASSQVRLVPQLAGHEGPVPHDDPEALALLLSRGFHSGGLEVNLGNFAPLDITINAARYFQLTGQSRALQLFRHLLLGLADYYLKTPGGASYPSDLDFRLGTIIIYYAYFEHWPCFTDDERLLLSNLLLSCSRSVHEYALKMRPIDPAKTTHHNHQTFKALSLHDAAQYFSRHGMSDVGAWREYAQAVLGEEIFARSKQTENAYGYEPFVYTHAATYALSQGHALSPQAQSTLQTLIHRLMTATDNFLRPLDYGDSKISMQLVDEGLARVLHAFDVENLSRWFGNVGFEQSGRYLPEFRYQYVPGLRLPAGQPPTCGQWELAPLCPKFAADYAPAIAAAKGFDKLAFRTGWGDDDQYLLVEGVGNASVAHAHIDVGSIVRYNHLGRHWLVSNGYGRRAGQSSAIKSFKHRVRGPEDHNTLVVRDGQGICRDIPACAQLVAMGAAGDLRYAITRLANYAGLDWTRSVLIHHGSYLLVIDHVQPAADHPGIEPMQAHVEWNCLGSITSRQGGYRIVQEGVMMDVTFDDASQTILAQADQSSDWKKVLGNGDYPHASFPLGKIVCPMPERALRQGGFIATLFEAHRDKPPYTLTRQGESLTIRGSHHPADVTIRAGHLTLAIQTDRCEIQHPCIITQQ